MKGGDNKTMISSVNSLKRKKKLKGDTIFYSVNNTLLFIAFIIVLYPLVYIVSASISSPDAVVAGKVWLFPVDFTLDGYKEVLNYKPIWTGYSNSLFYASVGTFINVVFTILAAYPLSRKDCYGRKYLTFMITFTMIFTGGLIPTYMLVQNVGLLNTRWALILPNLINVQNLIITKAFFQQNLTDDILEAAKIDGCTDFKFLIKIVLPLSKPIIAVIALYYGVFHWNKFFDAMIYLNDKSLYPLQLFLRDILVLNEVSAEMIADPEQMEAIEGMRELLKYSVIIAASIPVLIAYPFVQKFFVKGTMAGSAKG